VYRVEQQPFLALLAVARQLFPKHYRNSQIATLSFTSDAVSVVTRSIVPLMELLVTDDDRLDGGSSYGIP
jgi:hypothetical protein